jgi:hypothetical protein
VQFTHLQGKCSCIAIAVSGSCPLPIVPPGCFDTLLFPPRFLRQQAVAIAAGSLHVCKRVRRNLPTICWYGLVCAVTYTTAAGYTSLRCTVHRWCKKCADHTGTASLINDIVLRACTTKLGFLVMSMKDLGLSAMQYSIFSDEVLLLRLFLSDVNRCFPLQYQTTLPRSLASLRVSSIAPTLPFLCLELR